ncbi:MAG: PAS domain S-box protein [Aquabacterium sp.]|nr:MAG: PAS domain S-box protein [Aquabacterium sp.]
MDHRPLPRSYRVLARRLAVVWLVYTLVGYASLSLADPVHGISPLYFAAGVAVAFVAGWGPGMAFGIAAGSATLLFLTDDSSLHVGLNVGWLVGLVWIAGGALQALVAGALLRRFVAWPLVLERPGDVLRFFLIAGPVASLVASLLSTAAMGAAGLLDAGQWPRLALAWWAGDTLGALIGAPIALTLVGRPREVWAPRRTTVGLPLLIATVVLMLSIGQVQRWDRQREQAAFARDAAATADSVRLHLQSYLDALEALNGVYIASEQVTRDEFQRAARPWLRSLQGVRALGWHERVPRSDWPAFEARQVAEGMAGYRLFDLGGKPPAGDEAIAMRYVEPLAGNAVGLGFNVLSVPQARAALLEARAQNQPVASGPMRLIQETAQQKGVVVYRAVYAGHPGTREERMAATRGAVFISLRMEDTLAATLRSAPSYLGVCLMDVAAGAQARLAGDTSCPEPGQAAASGGEPGPVAVPLAFAGRNWELRIWPRGPVPLVGGAAANTWLFAGAGVFFSTALGALLLVMSARTWRIEEAVRERTLQLEIEVGERRRTEAALRESEQRFRAIFDHTPVGVAYADPQGGILQVNSGFCRMTGRTPGELAGMRLTDLLHAEDRFNAIELISRLGRQGGAILDGDWRVLQPVGQVRHARVHVQLLQSDASSGIVCVAEDVTERQQLRRAEAAREIAEAANRAKSEFLSRMSHELRTPLNAMLGFAQLMDMDSQNALPLPQRQRVEQIERAGWHLLEMINDVLDLSRIEAGTLRLNLEPLGLQEIVQSAIVMVEPQADRCQVAIRAAVHPPGLVVLADATRLKQLLTNLLTNAVKYNRPGGQVVLSSRMLGEGDVAIDVSDDGLGMSATQLSELFQPFNRLGRERSGTEGTGIGLVISQRLADLMGGTLAARSVEGQGSTFTLTLPASSAPPSSPPEAQVPDTLSGYHQRRVIYIEDNRTNVDVMRGILEQRPQVRFESYATAREGLAALREHPEGLLLLLDMHLPDMNGADVLRALKADPATADVPVVMVSADALAAQADLAMHLGAERYLAKPVDVNEVLAVVDDLLGAQATVW